MSSLIELVGSDTRTLLDELYPDKGDAPAPGPERVVPAPKSGVLCHLGLGFRGPVAPPERLPALDRQLDLLKRSAAEAVVLEEDQVLSLRADAQGIGRRAGAPTS